MKGIIYCATSPSSKRYYGYSSLTLEERKINHLERVKRGNKCRFFTAIRKYGEENFIWEIIEEHFAENKKDLHEILSLREKFWIQKEKTYLREYGYNMTLGGDGRLGSEMSEETKKNLISKLTGRTTERKGKTLKEEMIFKYGEEDGIKRYEIWIQKMRDAKLNKKLSETHKENISKNSRRFQSEETRNKIKKNHAKYWKGKHHSEETKKKMSNSHKN